MDNLTRVRRASVKVARVQRRIWLIQTAFVPAVVAAAACAAVAVGAWARRRYVAAAASNGVERATPPTETTALRNGATNGAEPG